MTHTTTPPSATPKPDRPRVALAALSGDREFRKVRSHGQLIRHALFTLRLTDYRPRYGEVWRPRAIMGIVVPKKTLRRAVDRNRVRRRVREALRTLPGGALIPCRAILMPGPGVLKVPFTELQAALAQSLGRFDPAAARKGGAGKGGSGRQGSAAAQPGGAPPAQARTVPVSRSGR